MAPKIEEDMPAQPIGKVSDYLLDSSREYSIYVNKTRHFPSFADGLKDAMRKALHVMRSKGRIKTAALSGAMTEQLLYVHGDASGSINSLAAPFGNNLPLLKAEGNFGTRLAPTAYSAPRYTEVEKPSYAAALVYADYDVIPMEPNFDGSTMQPTALLPILPLLLVNGMSGTGVGWNSLILPRKPEDVAAAVRAAINGEPIPRLTPHFNWCDAKVTSNGIHENGGSSWEFTGKVEIRDTSTLVVTELPPLMDIEDFRERLNGFEEKDKIVSYEDDSSSSIHITIKLKRGTAKDWTVADAVQFLNLRQSKTENFVVVSWDGTKIIHYAYDEKTKKDAAAQYIEDWVRWRFSWYVKRYEKLIKDDTYELNKLRAIKACFEAKLPEELRNIQDRDGVKSRIGGIAAAANVSPLDQDQVGYIADLPIHRWTVKSYDDIVRRIKELEATIGENTKTLKSDDRRRKVFTDEVVELASVMKKAEAEVQATRSPR